MHFSAKHPSASFEEQTMAALFSNITIPIVGRNHPHQYRFPCPLPQPNIQATSRVISLRPWSRNPLRPEMKPCDCIMPDRQAHLICCKPSDSMPPAHYGCPPTRSDSQIANRLRAAAPTGIQSASVDEHWSVAGQQGKIALRNRNGSWFSTTGIARTTHIIKPGIPTLPHQAFNEHITHAHCGGDGNTRGPHLFSHL